MKRFSIALLFCLSATMVRAFSRGDAAAPVVIPSPSATPIVKTAPSIVMTGGDTGNDLDALATTKAPPKPIETTAPAMLMTGSDVGSSKTSATTQAPIGIVITASGIIMTGQDPIAPAAPTRNKP